MLHTHLPYLRRNGTWPCGEDFFHQAAAESYLPLLGTLTRLGERGLRDALTISVSPMVAHQMADPHMIRELELYLGRIELRALRQVANYDGVFADEVKDLAAFYCTQARTQGELLDTLPGRSIASGLAALADAGAIEILGGPATHPYLPLIREPALAAAQLELGRTEHVRVLGRAPAGMWLPECAYAPGLAQLLDEHNVAHVVVDGPTMLRSAGPGSTFAPRRIADSDVVAFSRNLDVTYRVWSPTGGYPTGRWYRDFFHYDLEAGFKNWRVTSVRKPLHRKRPYEPAQGEAAARRDAEDFAALIATTLEQHERETGRDGVIVAAYDTELFGHWWFEGPAFLEHLFALLEQHPSVTPSSLAAARARMPEPEPVELLAGSWGFRKDERSWVADETQWMWDALGEVEAETVRLTEKHAGTDGEALAQLLREAFLLQSSDWPFMVLRGRNGDYAQDRFREHHERWRRLAGLLGRGSGRALSRAAVELFDVDNVLPDLDPAELLTR